jgi:hypothetical protein
MLKITILLFATLLIARENPFFPSESEYALPITTNIEEKMQPLKMEKTSLPDSARVLKKITFEYKNLDGTISTKSINVEKSVDWHLPLFVTQSYNASKNSKKVQRTKAKFKDEIADFKFISFWKLNDSLKIKTDDKLLRHFTLTSPHRVVMDFKADYSFETIDKDINTQPFKNIRIGNHRGYYRVVITLDGIYKTNIDEQKNSFILNCF